MKCSRFKAYRHASGFSLKVKGFILLLWMITGLFSCKLHAFDNEALIPAAWQTEVYVPLIEDKRVAFAGNHTATIAGTHLVDSLLQSGINIVKVFSPEHGFRGEAAAGEWVDSDTDSQTGLPVISLYGATRRPTREQLKDVDVILFDIQDVGARFYTYISWMTYIMEEAALAGLPVIILDRPNPNGHYIDGPLLEPEYASYVGLHPVPVVHGMTIGEYAMMVNGEGWLTGGLECDLNVITVKNYTHGSRYSLPLPPSPNLQNMHAIYLYPSLCFFEGTEISVGRGTDKAFQVFGHPGLPQNQYPYSFVPQSVRAAPNPPHLNTICHGLDLSVTAIDRLAEQTQINLSYLLEAYHHFPEKERFFNSFFERLAGTSRLRKQIIAGYTEEEIRKSWQDGLESFQRIRSKYLLYPDFK